MNRQISDTARGVAALALVDALLQKLVGKSLIARHEVIELLDDISRAAGHRGVAHNSEVETEASLLVSEMATALRREL